MWTELLSLAQSPKNIIEVLILFLLLWAVLTFLRGSRGEGMFKSLGMFLAIGFLFLRSAAIEAQLDRLTLVLDTIFQASVIALVVIFQPELRRGLALKIGQQWLTARVPEEQVVDEVVNACERLSKGRVGALIAFERKESLKSYVGTGTILDAEIKADLLMNIFYPGSPLHDGAVVVQGGRIAAAGCFLPLTDNPDVPKSLGTRHRAALGLSETEDAIVLVVSEETGIISLAERGKLHRNLDRDSLREMLRTHYIMPQKEDQGDLDVTGTPEELKSASHVPPPPPGKSTTRITRKIAT